MLHICFLLPAARSVYALCVRLSTLSRCWCLKVLNIASMRVGASRQNYLLHSDRPWLSSRRAAFLGVLQLSEHGCLLIACFCPTNSTASCGITSATLLPALDSSVLRGRRGAFDCNSSKTHAHVCLRPVSFPLSSTVRVCVFVCALILVEKAVGSGFKDTHSFSQHAAFFYLTCQWQKSGSIIFVFHCETVVYLKFHIYHEAWLRWWIYTLILLYC